jgi:hypothetical protein
MPRLTWFHWLDAHIGPIRTVTPRPGEDAPAPETDEQHIRHALGFADAVLRGDKRPVLVYFHWPHDDPVHGKLVRTVCTHTLDDEQAARWSQLFRCVQIDMAETETKFAGKIGCKGEPAFVALDGKLEVVARIPVTKSGSKLRKALEGALHKFPEAARKLRKDAAAQRKLLAEAHKLDKAGRTEDALRKVDKIRFGKVRVTAEFDKAVSYGQLLAQKSERELEHGGR